MAIHGGWRKVENVGLRIYITVETLVFVMVTGWYNPAGTMCFRWFILPASLIHALVASLFTVIVKNVPNKYNDSNTQQVLNGKNGTTVTQ